MISSSTEPREAAGENTDATLESYRIVVSRALAARESNSQLTRDFFEKTTVEIQEQIRLNHCATQLVAYTSEQGEIPGPAGPDDLYRLDPPPDRMRN